jgi:uncharacterized damage-inducible protein DinB
MPITPAAHYRMFGHYNAWANGRLYAAVARLSVEQYRVDRGAFFKSVHGTLNHLLVTDRIWMQRFTGMGDAPSRLDAILFETFDELRTARELEDRRIVDFVDSLDDARIAGTIKYRRVSSPEQFEQQLAPALAHWFNHQTHHRGQVHAVLTGLVGEAPELDLLFFQRLSAKPAARIVKTSLAKRRLARGGFAFAGANAAKLPIPPPQIP